jgi:GTPase
MQMGILHVGETLMLGPDALGHFVPCAINSIHRKRVAVPTTFAGQSTSFALKKIKRSSIRKGMVLVSRDADPKASWEFEAEILVLYHSSVRAIYPNVNVADDWRTLSSHDSLRKH